MSDDGKKLSKTVDDPLSANRDPNKKEWVKFEEDDGTAAALNEAKSENIKPKQDEPPVLDTASIHVTIENAPKTKADSNANGKAEKRPSKVVQVAVDSQLPSSSSEMRNVELTSEIIHQGFVNGEVIVTLLPVNENLPWITPAIFRPELVPEELMAQGLTLTVEEYVNAIELLVNDYRFTLYNVCYKRVLLCWISFAFVVLLGLLFSGITGILLFSLGVGWLFLNAVSIFFCMWIKLRILRGLEKCLARVNKQLLKHKIIIALDDRGNFSCHKINLCFIYFDAAPCISYINSFLERSEHNGQAIEPGWETRLDIDRNDIVIQGSNTRKHPKKENHGECLVLRYISRWGKDMMRCYLKVSQTQPARHMVNNLCPCQYIEEHLKCKPATNSYCLCCPMYPDVNHMYPY